MLGYRHHKWYVLELCNRNVLVHMIVWLIVGPQFRLLGLSSFPPRGCLQHQESMLEPPQESRGEFLQ